METQQTGKQSVLVEIFSEIGNTAREALWSVISKINNALKIPGALTCSGTDKVLVVNPTSLSKPVGRNASLFYCGVNLSGLNGSIDFATGIGSGDVQTVLLPTMSPDFFVYAGIEIRKDKKIYVVFGTEGVDANAAGFPSFSNESMPIGWVLLQDNAGVFNDVTMANVTQIESPQPMTLAPVIENQTVGAGGQQDFVLSSVVIPDSESKLFIKRNGVLQIGNYTVVSPTQIHFVSMIPEDSVMSFIVI